MNPGWMDPAQPIGYQDEDEQGNRQADAQGERLHGTIALAFVFHQEEQGRAQAGNDQDESDGDDYFHDVN